MSRAGKNSTLRGDVNDDGVEDSDHCGIYGSSTLSCDTEVIEKVDYINGVLARMGRGIQFELVEIQHLTDPPDPPPALGAPEWTNAPSLGSATQNLLETAANNDPDAFKYRDDAINYYIFNTIGGGPKRHVPRR